jgi:hypothetical protein
MRKIFWDVSSKPSDFPSKFHGWETVLTRLCRTIQSVGTAETARKILACLPRILTQFSVLRCHGWLVFLDAVTAEYSQRPSGTLSTSEVPIDLGRSNVLGGYG